MMETPQRPQLTVRTDHLMAKTVLLRKVRNDTSVVSGLERFTGCEEVTDNRAVVLWTKDTAGR